MSVPSLRSGTYSGVETLVLLLALGNACVTVILLASSRVIPSSNSISSCQAVVLSEVEGLSLSRLTVLNLKWRA